MVVVGASLAGLRAVETLRSAGFDGRLSLVGAEEHLPYDRPPLSKEILQGTMAPEEDWLRPPDQLAELALDLHLGRRAESLDLQSRHVGLDGGERLGFDGLVIATGSHPRTLPGQPAIGGLGGRSRPGRRREGSPPHGAAPVRGGPPNQLEGVHVLRTLDDCLAIRAELEHEPRVVVVGAGFIGSEVAASARGRGLDVTVVEALAAPLERALGPEMGAACGAIHGDHGVRLRCGVGVAAIEGSAHVERVRLSDGTTLEADLVVVGVGVVPTTGWLEGSGLRLADGVVCDSTCATGAPGVYAAGDACRWENPLFGEVMRVEHWDNASQQGRAAARNLLSGPESAEPFAPVPYFWSDQYDVKIQFVGRAAPYDDVRVVDGSPEERRFVALYARKGRLIGALGLSRPRLIMGYRNLIAGKASFEEALRHPATT